MNFSLTDLLRLIGVTSITLPLTCASVGCASAERAEQVATFKEVSLFAKEHGFAGQANLNIGGQPAFDLRTGGVLDTGVQGSVSIQFNSLAQPRGKAETAVGDTATMFPSNETPVEGGE